MDRYEFLAWFPLVLILILVVISYLASGDFAGFLFFLITLALIYGIYKWIDFWTKKSEELKHGNNESTEWQNY